MSYKIEFKALDDIDTYQELKNFLGFAAKWKNKRKDHYHLKFVLSDKYGTQLTEKKRKVLEASKKFGYKVNFWTESYGTYRGVEMATLDVPFVKEEPQTMEKVDAKPTELQPFVAEWYEKHPGYELYRVEPVRYEAKPTDYAYHYLYKDWDYEVIINITDMEVVKYGPRKMHKLFDDELEFFDKLGFDITKEHKTNVGQNIEDWYDAK